MNQATQTTRQRIIDAAGDIFGKQGFKAATVREICTYAGVNLAAVNYYFGGKQQLYREVASDLIAKTFERFPLDQGVTAADPPQKRLKAFILAILQRLLTPGGFAGFTGKGQLVARELADPSPILDDLINSFLRPTAAVLAGIIAELLGPRASQKEIVRCQVSVIGQCFHYALARPILTRLVALDYREKGFIVKLAEHVTRFSLAGIGAIKAQIDARDADG